MRIQPSHYILQHDLFVLSWLVVQLVVVALVRLVSLVDRVELVEIGFGGRFGCDLSHRHNLHKHTRGEMRTAGNYFIACAVVE